MKNQKKLRVLFIGNSHTYYNDMLNMVAQRFREEGYDCEVTMLAHGGWFLDQHVQEPDILLERTDEDHMLNATELCNILQQEYDISTERRTIYSEIETLTHYGLNIIKDNGRMGGYYVASRRFELPEMFWEDIDWLKRRIIRRNYMRAERLRFGKRNADC